MRGRGSVITFLLLSVFLYGCARRVGVRTFRSPTAGIFLFLLLSVFLYGCARRVGVRTFRSPTAGIFLTVETYDGGPGPLGSDITKVYAHFERHGSSARAPVLEGDSLTVPKIIWNAPDEDTICLDGGITDIFHNQVTLIVGNGREDSVTIRNHLDEHCREAGNAGMRRSPAISR